MTVPPVTRRFPYRLFYRNLMSRLLFTEKPTLVRELSLHPYPELTLIKDGALQLIWSAVIDLENQANPDLERRKTVEKWQSCADIDIATTEQVEDIAETLSDKGIKAMDALHVASAIVAKTAYFLTTDKALLRKMSGHKQIYVIDPIDFLRVLGESDEN